MLRDDELSSPRAYQPIERAAGIDGRIWIRANRVVVYGCFTLWAGLAVLQATRGQQ